MVFILHVFHRKQAVQIQQVMSEPTYVTSGVPQDSILSPLLFIIYMNDMTLEAEQTDSDMYTDDITLSATAGSVDLVE